MPSELQMLDKDGRVIYPSWANAIPAEASPKSAQIRRPPWVPEWSSAWDDAKAPKGWSKDSDGNWHNSKAAAAAVPAPPAASADPDAAVEYDQTNDLVGRRHNSKRMYIKGKKGR